MYLEDTTTPPPVLSQVEPLSSIVGSLPAPPGSSRPHPAELDAWLKERGVFDRVLALHRPKRTRALAQVAMSWSVIAACCALVVTRPVPLAWAVALVLVGTRQRALLNSLHDASHVRAFGGRTATRWVAELLLALPLWDGYRVYRQLHLRHHIHLGRPGQDPDVVELRGNPRTPARVYFDVFFNPKVWRQSVVGSWRVLNAEERARAVAFTVGVLAVVAAVASPRAAASVALLWWGARATTFHAIRVFAEISDHVGLPQVDDALLATRNMPRNLLTWLLHPHGDNYHLAHHLFPAVPLANLEQLHGILLGYPPYASSAHCDGYFFGTRATARGWVERALAPARLPERF